MIAPFLAGLALLQAMSAADYVPDTGWRDNEWAHAFYERWFGNQLKAMREPPLSSEADLAGYRERFRLLVLPTFQPAYAYRIDVRQDGTAVLRWARLNGAGGYAPGRLARQGSRPLRAEELQAWREALAAATLGSLTQDERGPVEREDGSIVICPDATTSIFEYLDRSGRTYVARYCEIEAPLLRLESVVYNMQPLDGTN